MAGKSDPNDPTSARSDEGESSGVSDSGASEPNSSIDFAAEGPTLMWTADSLAEAGVKLPVPISESAPATPAATQPQESARSSFEIDPSLMEEDTGAGLRGSGKDSRWWASGGALVGIALLVGAFVVGIAALAF